MILVVGAGVAGLSAALAAVASGAAVHLVTAGALLPTAGEPTHANTPLAQGGIAAAIGHEDRADLHAHDTCVAGVGLVDAAAAALLTRAGADRVRQLIAQGFDVDRAPDGAVALGLEAAHSHPRIVHSGEDRTGAGLYAMLSEQVWELVQQGRIHLTEHHALMELVMRDGAVIGAMLRDALGIAHRFEAGAVVLATGGYAALWQRTSNHRGAQGMGIVRAAQVGAVLSDLEFVQFHPTVLAGTDFLISEAVRGAGAVLRDGAGRRFMPALHPAAELAPRDVVSREIHRVLLQRGETSVWLDATGIEDVGGVGTLARRFPKITAAVAAHGCDWTKQPIPVAPAAHYSMGGVATDSDGHTTVPGLFAAGEVAATGVHGANRLASNSLLEGLVFGDRAGRAAAAFITSPHRWEIQGDALPALLTDGELGELILPSPRDENEPERAVDLDTALGIERSAAPLRSVIADCAGLTGPAAILTSLIAEAALARTESRGAHQRADYPQTDPTQARRRGWLSSVTPTPTPTTSNDVRRLAAC